MEHLLTILSDHCLWLNATNLLHTASFLQRSKTQLMNTSLPRPDLNVRPWRKHVLRFAFLVAFIGLYDNWMTVFSPGKFLDPWVGVAVSFYAAFSVLCLLGLRFPLKFLPLLLVQLIYKSAWIISTYLPAHLCGEVDENLQSWLWVMAPGIVIDLVVIPWQYVYRAYLKYLFRKEIIIEG